MFLHNISQQISVSLCVVVVFVVEASCSGDHRHHHVTQACQERLLSTEGPAVLYSLSHVDHNPGDEADECEDSKSFKSQRVFESAVPSFNTA